MKNPWLAALLNIIPGLGYLYLNIRRVLGWLLLGGFAAFCISLFDPSLNSSTSASTSGIWLLWSILFLVLPYAGFIIDGYMEANRINSAGAKTVAKKKPASRLAAGSTSPELFVILSFATLGMYQVYWSWRLWETVRRSKNETYRFRSSLRGLTNGLSNFWLFPQLRDLAAEHGYETNFDVELLAAAYLLLSFIAGLQFIPLGAIPFLALAYSVVLLPIVNIQNHYAAATKGKFAPTRPNWWLIIILVLIFVLAATVLGLNAATQH